LAAVAALAVAAVSAQPATDSQAAHDTHSEQGMPGFFGRYPASREASGTSWQPEATPHEGQMVELGEWQGMVHGTFAYVATDQRGPRGASETYSTNMLMAMLSRTLGQGRVGARGMLTLEPETVGAGGYPSLLQTGETADGFSHLLDRQHAHDTFMELALTYSHPIGDALSVFVYGGFSGEPAIGPPAFMHRFSGMEFPDSPISHHWLDSTHTSYSVLTTGLASDKFKIEVSGFRGREPDQYRWDLERGRIDSYSARLSWNPNINWSFQVSAADVESPEQIAPYVNLERVTVSAAYQRTLPSGEWHALMAWGRNDNEPGNTLDATLFESMFRFRTRHSWLGRMERVEKDELAPHTHGPGGVTIDPITTVSRLSLGYVYDFVAKPNGGRLGVGLLVNKHFVPGVLDATYGGDPLSYSLFLRGRF
jgi:hypothetical protein